MILITNRKARHDYSILETFEAGIQLIGPEVKSLRQRRGNLSEGFARPMKGELFLCGFHISPYEQANRENADPLRERKLLLHKREIAYLIGQVSQKGHALIPLKVYLKKGKIKVEIGLAKGKFMIDKRETLKRREADREAERVMKFHKDKRVR